MLILDEPVFQRTESKMQYLFKSSPIFIIGLPRSGTKLLREILNQHDKVSIPRAETGFIPFFYYRRKFYKNLHVRKNFKKFYDDFKKTSFFYYINNADEIWTESGIYEYCTDHSISKILEAIYSLHAEFEKKPIWGDKTPEYLYHTRLIKKLFPNTRFIHIIRDVRDYCLSTRKAWNKNIYRAAQKWVDGIEFVRQETSTIKKDYYEIKYENLIDEPAYEVEKVCKWLGIKYTPDLIEIKGQIENLGDSKNKSGILMNNYEKWRFGLTPSEILKVEAIAGKMLLKLGYCVKSKQVQKPLTQIEKLFYGLDDILKLMIFRTKEYKNPTLAFKRLLRDLKFKRLKTYSKSLG